jgi:prepilin-type processing-associated H-X9-DG protein
VKANFIPVGLGILVARGDLTDVHVLDCPSMRSGAKTFYNNNEYRYDATVWQKIVGSPALGTPEEMFLAGDGQQLFQTPADTDMHVVGILSSYSYRDTPFYYVPALDDSAHSGTCIAPLDSVSPQVFPQWMTPAFKTRRALHDRAICSDSFDYAYNANVTGGGFGFSLGGGLANAAHKDGYNVLYGDGHVKWYEDSDHQISSFNRWRHAGAVGTILSDFGADDLTISSPTSQLVWNLFDRAAGIDIGQ